MVRLSIPAHLTEVSAICSRIVPLVSSSYSCVGIGAYKLGANYAAGVAAQKAAAQKGYVQNLWLHGPEHHITEVGTMNAFVVFKRDNGGGSGLSSP